MLGGSFFINVQDEDDQKECSTLVIIYVVKTNLITVLTQRVIPRAIHMIAEKQCTNNKTVYTDLTQIKLTSFAARARFIK